MKINKNYYDLTESYLFSTIARKVKAYSDANPDANITKLGIGDVTLPLAPSVITAMHKAHTADFGRHSSLQNLTNQV